VWAGVWLLLPTEIRMSDPENSFSEAEKDMWPTEEAGDSDETDEELIELIVKWISKPDSPDLVQPVRRGVLEHLVVSPVPDFNLPATLESVPPMGAGYVSPVVRRHQPIDFLWEPDTDEESEEDSEEEYVPIYRLPWWHLADEVPENDGTWEEVLSAEQTRPSTPVELSANANAPIPPDEGFGEFPPTDRALTFNGGLWHYGKRLAVTEKGWILPPCCSAHLCRRPGALSRHAYESITFVCRKPEVIYAHALIGSMVKKIRLYAGLNIVVWCVADLQFDYCGAFDVMSRYSGRGLYSTDLCFRAEGDTCWRYYYSPMYRGRFPFRMQHGYTEVYPGEEDPSCAVYITAIGQVPTLQQLARVRLGYKTLRAGAYTALGERLRKGPTWNDGAIRHTILLLSTRRVRVKGWRPAPDQIIYS